MFEIFSTLKNKFSANYRLILVISKQIEKELRNVNDKKLVDMIENDPSFLKLAKHVHKSLDKDLKDSIDINQLAKVLKLHKNSLKRAISTKT